MTALAVTPSAVASTNGSLPEGVLVGGRFHLKEQLGRGSMARVFRAADLAGGRDVAVKIAVDDSPKHRGRIANEAAVLASLDHPSVVTFFEEGTMPGQGELSGRPYIVEELALGRSLAEAVRGPLRSPLEIAALAVGLFDGLSHLHGRGLVHRDIKPANLMLSGLRRSPVRIVDFGITAAAGAAPEPGMSSGTVHYMSPEQASGGAVRPSWDVYALGLVLLELLTGARAYTGTAVESLVARTLRSPVVPAALGPGWVALLRAVTAMDSAARPSAAEAAVMARRLAAIPQPARLLHRR
ncbi:MAG: serine/threonine-protein kinase [Pseudarthrobacter sp.]